MNDTPTSRASVVADARGTLERLRDSLEDLPIGVRSSRVGRVVTVGDGVARARGLRRPVTGELVHIEGIPARIESVQEAELQLVLLGRGRIESGDTVRSTGRVLNIPAGSELVGRVINAVGAPIDGEGPLHARRRIRVEREPIPLVDREPVARPLRTGVYVVDTMVPIGRGQRQLVIGDRGTGKTSLCLDMLAALDRSVIGVYVAIGRRGAETSGHLGWLRRHRFFEHGLAVVAAADDPVGLVHLAPYSATAIAEDLMLSGRDVVIVYDDLTTHAHAHRTLALLLGRPVAREAFPADIFYAHARMLERSTQLGQSQGQGSLTALPIVESQAGDLSAYIPTNIVSITDGQIRLHAGLAAAGQRPAVDVGLSVSRVGGKAQPKTVRSLAGSLKNEYAQFLELEAFARFGTQLEGGAQQLVSWGRRVRQALRQPRGQSWSWGEIVARTMLLRIPELRSLPEQDMETLLDRGMQAIRVAEPDAWAALVVGDMVSAEALATMEQAGRQWLKTQRPDLETDERGEPSSTETSHDAQPSETRGPGRAAEGDEDS